MTTKLAQPFFSPDVRVDDLQWREVEQVGAVKLSSDLRAHLLGEMTRYREDSDGYSAAVRPGKVRRLLEEAAGAGRDFDAALVKLLRAAPPESPAAMRAIAQAAVAADKRYAGRSELKALRAEVKRWMSYIDAAFKALPRDRGGRAGDPHLDRLIVAAQSVFASAGGRGKYTPSALRFCCAVCRLAGHHPQSRKAFQKHVQRALDKSQR